LFEEDVPLEQEHSGVQWFHLLMSCTDFFHPAVAMIAMLETQSEG
jgi:hypothetical protein